MFSSALMLVTNQIQLNPVITYTVGNRNSVWVIFRENLYARIIIMRCLGLTSGQIAGFDLIIQTCMGVIYVANIRN